MQPKDAPDIRARPDSQTFADARPSEIRTRIGRSEVLYELSLSVGASLDPVETCNAFLESLISLANLSYCAVLLPELACSENRHAKLRVLSELPTTSDRTLNVPFGVRDKARKEGAAGLSTAQLRAMNVPNLGSGEVATIYPLAESGFLLLVATDQRGVASTLDLTRVVKSFARSLDACYEHQRLVDAGKARIQEERHRSNAERTRLVRGLAGGIAHELNNALGPMMVYPDLIGEHVSASGELLEDLEALKHAAGQIADMTADLLVLSTRDGVDPEDTQVLSESLSVFLDSDSFHKLASGSPSVTVVTDLRTQCVVQSSDTFLNRIALKLTSNAFLRLGGRGSLSITARRVYLEQPERLGNGAPSGAFGVLEVCDSGPTLSQAQIESAFEPFSNDGTTPLKGARLGLAVVQASVKQLGGFLTVDSRPGTTRFSVFLPEGQTREPAPNEGQPPA